MIMKLVLAFRPLLCWTSPTNFFKILSRTPVSFQAKYSNLNLLSSSEIFSKICSEGNFFGDSILDLDKILLLYILCQKKAL